MDWLDLLAVQETLKSLLQHHSSKASILQPSAFFKVQLSYPYMTTGKIIALTVGDFVGKVMSLLFNMLSRLVITFLPRSKCLLISWLQSPSKWFWNPRKWSLSLFPLYPHQGGLHDAKFSPHSWKMEGCGHSRVGPRVSAKEEFRQLSAEVGLLQKWVDTWCQSQRVPIGPARLSSLWPLGTRALSSLLRTRDNWCLWFISS